MAILLQKFCFCKTTKHTRRKELLSCIPLTVLSSIVTIIIISWDLQHFCMWSFDTTYDTMRKKLYPEVREQSFVQILSSLIIPLATCLIFACVLSVAPMIRWERICFLEIPEQPLVQWFRSYLILSVIGFIFPIYFLVLPKIPWEMSFSSMVKITIKSIYEWLHFYEHIFFDFTKSTLRKGIITWFTTLRSTNNL